MCPGAYGSFALSLLLRCCGVPLPFPQTLTTVFKAMRAVLHVLQIFAFVSRSGAFAPALSSQCLPVSKRSSHGAVRAVPDPTGNVAAEKALERAAQLRQEVADLEEELAKGKPKLQDDEQQREVLGTVMEPSSPFTLAPSQWLVMMDVGREKGTWMPQNWGISGRRVEVDLLVKFLPGGDMEAKVDSPFVDMTVTPGRWSVGAAEGKNRRRPASSLGSLTSDTCRFWVETSGLTKGDVTIPEGKVFFAVPCWGGKLSRKGLITVRQRRWLVREESRILGVLKTELLVPDAEGRIPLRAPRPRTPPFPDGFRDG